jgi:hypothetical protein
MKKLGLQNITIKDVLISILILVVTFGYFFVNYIEEGVKSVDVLGFTIGSFGFQDISDMVYFVKMKLIIIVFSIIWYFTCKHWWKSAILVIITIELLKLLSALNSNQEYVDEIEYYSSLPITIPIILLIIFIAKKINDYNLANNLRSELDYKINSIFFELHKEKKDDAEKLKNDFRKLKNNEKIIGSHSIYLNKLIQMRDNFYEI